MPKRFRRKHRSPLNYDKYLSGRSYQIFKNAIRSNKSLRLYRQYLFHFCDYINMTTEDIVSKYGASQNARASIDLQHRVEDYAILLQNRVSNQEMTAKTCAVMISPIKLLCEMNDIILN